MNRRLLFPLSALLVTLARPAGAETHGLLLGTDPPPDQLGPIPVAPFDLEAQAKIPDYTHVAIIPGSPIPGDLVVEPLVQKLTVPDTWPYWSHGYEGPIFFNAGLKPVQGSGQSRGLFQTVTLSLPPGATAVYLYVQPWDGTLVYVTTDDGTSINTSVSSTAAEGFGFYTDTAGETIATLLVEVGDTEFFIGEFGISNQPVAVELQWIAID